MKAETCIVTVDAQGQELARHGSPDFPIASYDDRLCLNPVPWHWHEELEAGIVCQGSMLLGYGEEQRMVHAGEGFFINSSVLHGCWDQEHTDCRIHSAVFHMRLISGTQDSIYYQKYLHRVLHYQLSSGLILSPQIPWQSAVLQHIDAAWQSMEQGDTGYEFEVREHFSQILLLLYRNLPVHTPASDSHMQQNTQRIKIMLQFIHAHFHEKITVSEIAESAAISESECLRCFQSTIHITPNRYLRQYRIQQASYLLVSTSEKISSIAHSCGFEDMSFFAKTFREWKGESPSAYREHQLS